MHPEFLKRLDQKHMSNTYLFTGMVWEYKTPSVSLNYIFEVKKIEGQGHKARHKICNN